MSSPKIAFICGSLRTGSINQKLQAALMGRAKKLGADIIDIDLGSYDLPIFHGDLELPSGVKNLITDMMACDGIIITTPEYNGSLPPLLKNAIDWVSTQAKTPFTNPVYGIASCSPGPMSGIMCMRQLNYILMRLGAEVVPTQVGTGNASNAFDDAGHLTAEPSNSFAERMIAQVLTRISQKSK